MEMSSGSGFKQFHKEGVACPHWLIKEKLGNAKTQISCFNFDACIIKKIPDQCLSAFGWRGSRTVFFVPQT